MHVMIVERCKRLRCLGLGKNRQFVVMAVIKVAASNMLARVFRGRQAVAFAPHSKAAVRSWPNALTLIDGRQSFVQVADRAFAEQQRFDRALLRIDIDQSESFSEGFEQPAAMALLDGTQNTIGETIDRLHGRNALFARIDEAAFASVVGHGSSDEVITMADIIREEVKQAVVVFRGSRLMATVSIGIVFCLRATTADEALEVAELALERAKTNGRDQWQAIAQGGVREVIRRPRHPMLTRGPTRA
jgi:GGDEF domain-containing protein